MAHPKRLKHRKPIEGGLNPCLNCPPIPSVAQMDKLIAIGFGTAEVRRNGKMVIDGEKEAQEHDRWVTFEDAEQAAEKYPSHDWTVVLHGPLHGETYQRQGPRNWVLVERNEGFA